MNFQKKLTVGMILFVLTLVITFPSQVLAYTAAEINSGRAENKYAFADKNASVITMRIAGDTLRFQRRTTPPENTNNGLYSVAASYIYELQGNTNDNCRQGVLTSDLTGTTRIASIRVTASNIDTNPDPDKIDGSLTFFRKVGDKCTNEGVQSAIQINNPFDAELKVPEGERSAATSGGNDDENLSCDTKLANPLSWILCPIIELGANFTDYVFSSIVKPLLAEVPVSTNPNDPGYKAWNQFRIIGNIVLVGTMLAVVYAQVRGER